MFADVEMLYFMEQFGPRDTGTFSLADYGNR